MPEFEIAAEYRRKLDIKKFEGLLCRHPMHRDGKKTLFWTIQHGAKISYGGYEVFDGKRSKIFFNLQEAVDYFNSGG